jgi:nucleoside-diphosphate-sugar epimerase
MLEAEQLARARTRAEVVVARLGGIYGPGPGAFLRSVAAGELHLPDRPAWTNRIQVDDAARALLHLAELPQPAALYNVVDDTPATRHEVAAWARAELGLPALRLEGPGGNSAGKRCSNALLRASGFDLLFPGYRQGYRGPLDELAVATNSADP